MWWLFLLLSALLRPLPSSSTFFQPGQTLLPAGLVFCRQNFVQVRYFLHAPRQCRLAIPFLFPCLSFHIYAWIIRLSAVGGPLLSAATSTLCRGGIAGGGLKCIRWSGLPHIHRLINNAAAPCSQSSIFFFLGPPVGFVVFFLYAKAVQRFEMDRYDDLDVGSRGDFVDIL